MITPSQEYFLQSLSDFLRGSASEVATLNGDLQSEDKTGIKNGSVMDMSDWMDVLELAEKQALEGVLYYQCKTLMPEDVKRKYLKQYVGNAISSFRRKAIVSELSAHLEEQGVRVIFMKGSVIRDYYPVPLLRSMGDMDIVIRPEDRKKVDRILRNEMGYERFIDNHAVWTYWKDTIYIEVHDHMFYEELANRADYRTYFDKVWDHCHKGEVFGISSDSILIPDEEFHFLYLMTHTAKHIINSGSGFRAYIDMAVISKTGKYMDWEYIEKELTELSLLTFTRNCLALCCRWFGVTSPMELAELDEEFIQQVTDKTFRDGVFGLENRENVEANAAKQIRRFDGPYYLGALKQTFRRLFPAYKDMQLIPWYYYVDGRPWLMPFAWVYRWFYCTVVKVKPSWSLLVQPFAHKKEVENRQRYLAKWGL